jgi:hypothetical protein
VRLVAVLLCFAACSFDSSGTTGGAGGGVGGAGGTGGSGGTGGTGATGGTGGNQCTGSCSSIAGEIRVNGIVWTSDTLPAAMRIVGDTISLDTSAVCTPSGQVALTWSTNPAQTVFSPSPNAASVLAYTTAPGDFHVTLRISDPGCTSAAPLDVTVWALTALGPQPLATNPVGGATNTVNDVDTGGGMVWTATGNGGFTIELAPPRSQWVDLEAARGGTFVAGNLSTVFFDASNALVWFAANGAQSAVDNIGVTTGPVTAIDVSANAGHNLVVGGFSRGAGPVHLAADRGLMDWTSGTAFTNIRQVGNDNLSAVAELAGQPLWAGGSKLDDFSAIPPSGLSISGGNDDKIRALALDGTHLWVGTDGQGLVRTDAATATIQETLTMMSAAPKNLPGNKIRDLAVDGQDIWIATDQGIARYKLDAGAVVSYKQSAPGMNITGPQLDTRGIAVDRSTGVRRVFAATAAGVLVLETP